MDDVAVLEDAADAVVALDPVRASVLAALAAEPGSAGGLAARLGVPRQRLGYHVTALEDRGLVVEVERRRHGGLVERVLSASAASYVVSPAAMGPAALSPERVGDRLSSAYVVALAARVVRELGAALRGAQRVPALSLDADVRFASAADRAAFADDLAAAFASLIARYHDESAAGGRWYRVLALSHPRPRQEHQP